MFEYRIPDDTIVIVYQMGHVGSQTVYATLKHNKCPVLHSHYFSNYSYNHLKKLVKKYKDQNNIHKAERFQHKVDSFKVKFVPLNQRPKRKVIILVRDPVARDISSIFYELDKAMMPTSWHRESNSQVVIYNIIIKALRDMNSQEPVSIDKWFDKELKGFFNFDVFKIPFTEDDRKKGYKIYQQGNNSFMLIRLEDLNRCYKNAFKEFLGININRLILSNVAHMKAYKNYYNQFKATAKIPSGILDRYYQIKYARHFYSQEELSDFRKFWSGKKDIVPKTKTGQDKSGLYNYLLRKIRTFNQPSLTN